MPASLPTSPTLATETSTARESKYLVALIALHLLAITLPYLWCATITPDGQIWGGLLYNPDDQNVHLAWAKQAAQGHFFFRDSFTTENLSDASRPLFTNLLCWAMGVLSLVAHLPLVVVYHLIRVVFAALALWWFHRLCARWSDDARVRLLAVAIAAFGGGFGWIHEVAPLGVGTWIDRPDLPQPLPMMPEAFGFTSAVIFPLNITAMALLVLVFERVLHARQTNAGRDVAIAIIAAFLLSNIHTYDALPLCLVLLIGGVWNGRSQSTLDAAPQVLWARAAPWLAIAGAALPVAYQLVVFRNSEEFRIKALTPTPAPPFFDIAWSYGPWLLLAIIGIVVAARERNAKVLWPALWLVVTVVLIYAPVSFARKMIEGMHWPLAFFAAIAIVRGLKVLPSPIVRRAVAIGIVVLLSISSWQFVLWCIGPNWRDNNLSRGPMMPPLRFSQGDWVALQWLNSQPNTSKTAILCFPKLGNYAPRETGMNTFIGHWAETLNLQGSDGKLAQMTRFYEGRMNRDEALRWLGENRIHYVIEGEYERGLFESTLPSARLGLRSIYNQNGTAIYAVP